MADVRCPMCGKTNPAEADLCQYCEARLKPLVANPLGAEDPQAGDGEAAQPDWLQDLRHPDEEEPYPEAEDSPLISASDLPDWLSNPRPDEPQAESLDSESVDDQVDWLRRLDGESDRPAGAGPAFYESSADAEPQNEPDAGQSGGDTGLPDWLARSGTDEPAPEASSPESGMATDTAGDSELQRPGGDQPDWLSRIRARQLDEQLPEEAPAEMEPYHVEGTVPDWLSSLQDVEPDDAPLQESEPPPAEAEVPDWLKRAGESTPPSETEPASGGLPDWLSGSVAVFDTPEGEGGEPAEESPDWLSQAQSVSAEAEELTGPGAGIPERSSEPPAGLDEPEAAQALNEAALAAPEGEAGETTPDWLKNMEGRVQGIQEGSDSDLTLEESDLLASPFEPDSEGEAEAPDLSAEPEWLSSVSSEEPVPADPEASSGLAPADMPGWLAAMRPVESAAPSTPVYGSEETDPEHGGPLAGLRGVLPAEPEFSKGRKLRGFSTRLDVTETQAAHVALLESMLAAESQPRPLPAGTSVAPQYVLRVLIALLLIVGVLSGLWLDQNLLPLSSGANMPEEVTDAMRSVGLVQPGQVVLVAFDYEPGFSGELDAASSAILAQLARRGAQMALVSTSPTGPVMAERVMSGLQSRQGLVPGGVVNLGFIPGGPAGLLAFANDPPAILPFAVDGMQAWMSGPMSRVQSAADFGLVLVITENADTARGWVEQVQPFLQQSETSPAVPLVMVISAQAEPMVRPYYEANPRQVSGMIAGLAGGAAYENISNQPGLVSGYWDAYGFGLLVAAALIIVAGLYNLTVSSLFPEKARKGEAVL